ncbi:heme-binding protein [Vibrio campbellii]|uniref:GlcG/HbpS family heme-binding protein n=1 Tax=Vibrio campbellii TaxID=680 RepID=UPI003D14EB09
MWGTIVARDGTVCVVAKTGGIFGEQWPGSRVISAQKANTANAFSLPELSLSTANLWKATQPGGSLFGLQFSNPVNSELAFKGHSKNFGQHNDPMINHRIGGINVFGGGLALYNEQGEIVGGLGVSGDTSCADHNIAWKTRNALKLDFVPKGISETGDDNIIYDNNNGFSHVNCGNGEQDIAQNLPNSFPISKIK